VPFYGVNMYFILELLGTVAFAISGATLGILKKMDILGIVVLGVTTSVGGGVIRDLIIGITPPMAFQQPIYAIISIIVSIIVFIPYIRNRLKENNIILLIIDSIGLGVFTVIGTKAGVGFNNIFLQIFLGTVTGVGGGVMRDIFACEKPTIFIKRFYACASIAGAILFVILYPLGENIAMIFGMILVIILRLLAAKYKWNLPRAK